MSDRATVTGIFVGNDGALAQALLPGAGANAPVIT
jgi:hypothetical protein